MTMPSFEIIVSVILVLVGVLGFFWSRQLGPVRGSLAVICRLLWVLPILCGLFPKTFVELLPGTINLRTIHILVDDSASMTNVAYRNQSRSVFANRMVQEIKDECVRLGCVLKTRLMSEEDATTKRGFSPIANALSTWLFRIHPAPWLFISDGGDSRPTAAWPQSLRLKGQGDAGAGLIVGFEPSEQRNLSIEEVDVPPLAFEGQPVTGSIVIKRAGIPGFPLHLQVQAMSESETLATANVEFSGKEERITAGITIPPLARGQHLLGLRVLPVEGERTLWDNEMFAQVEVMPNTLGVLHLLGGPSWDGRFLRRALKAEPKYDLISFFILRDPWDSQEVNDRELSLIPFPVARLFNEELPNFRVIILQNFNLLQFLLPEYQENLVKFVRKGGGLFFIGGSRALKSNDIQNSPLREILPFELADRAVGEMPTLFNDFDAQTSSKTGAWYDDDLSYKIEFANPQPNKRALANVYDTWETLAKPLTQLEGLHGLHHLENVTFRNRESTPLLYARTKDGGRVPLAVASYPDKGRAIWLFTDSIWKLANNPQVETSREVYHEFIQGALTWLLRKDFKKTLLAKGFDLRVTPNGTEWEALLQGPATRYFGRSQAWTLEVCGHLVPIDDVRIDKYSADEWAISGLLAAQMKGNERCDLRINGEDAALGSVQVSTAAIIPAEYTDDKNVDSPERLASLAKFTGAKLALVKADGAHERALSTFVSHVTNHEGIVRPPRYKTTRDFFWILESAWWWLLLLFLPLEVIIRRWDRVNIGRR